MAFEVVDTIRLASELYRADPSAVVKDNSWWARQQFGQHADQAIPVLICARNEANDLPGALLSLARSHEPVLPVVVDNGSEDGTAAIAEKMGAIVLHEPEKGKTAAYQIGLRFIREEYPKRDVILATDADSVVSRNWSGSMSRKGARLQKTGGVTFGLVVVMGGESKPTDALRTAIMNGKQIYAAIRKIKPGARGHNTALTFDSECNIIDALLALPNVFPGNDRAIRDSVICAGGIAQANFSESSFVATRGDRYSSLPQYISAIRGKTTPEQVYGKDFVEKYDDGAAA